MNYQPQNSPNVPPAKTPLSGLNKFFSIFSKFIIGIGIIAGIIAVWPIVKDWIHSDKQKFDEAKGPSGDLNMPLSRSTDSTAEIEKFLVSKPPKDTNALGLANHLPDGFKFIKDGEEFKGIHIPELLKMDNMFVYSLCNGSSMIGIDVLYRGINIFKTTSTYHINDSFFIRAVNDRVYVSATFTDLETGSAVATIEYNHWHVITANSLIYFPTDTSLEVRDNRNQIILSIIYFKGTGNSQDRDKLKINGYFIDNASVLVSGIPGTIGANPISKTDRDWKAKARAEIGKIPSIVVSSPKQIQD